MKLFLSLTHLMRHLVWVWLGLVSLLAQGQYSQVQKITANPRESNAEYGGDVAVDGAVMVVGARRLDSGGGAAYVYELSGGTWTQTQKLVASDRTRGDVFGTSVAISGSTIVVGALREDEDASGGNTLNDPGSAYVFEKSGSTWTQTQKLVASDRTDGDFFGSSVAISGSTLVVGADGDAGQAGSAYVFEKSGSTWAQAQKLVASDRAAADIFGISVGISGTTIVVGAVFEDEDASGQNTVSGAGSAYVFEKSGSTWTQAQKLVASDRAGSDYFGRSVAISGSTLVVGAEFEDEDASGGNTLSNAGSAYVFEKSGSTWTQAQKLVANDRAAGDQFGWSVAISGSTLVVGADGDAGQAGSAYVFEKSGSTWAQSQKLVANDRAAEDRFGRSVAISGSIIVVGAEFEDEDASGGNTLSNAGSAYVFGPGCPVSGSTAYVNAAVGSSGDGSGWATAFKTLQEALTATSTCPNITQIWVAKGTYYPTADASGNASPTDPRDKTFYLKDGVAIYGGFPDTGNPTLSERDWRTYPTTLNGEIQQDNDPGNNAYHVVLSANDGPATRLDGFTITGGNANGGGSITVEGQGFDRHLAGGANLMNSSPQLVNLLVTGNAANIFGGIRAYNGSPTLKNVAILNHSNGGMAYITGSINPLVITMTNVVFAGNSTNSGGGGLQLNGQNMTANLTNVVFANNSASNTGGAMVNAACTTNLVNCTFYNNSAGGSGGAMYNVTATVNDKNGIYYNNNNGNTAYSGVFNFNSSGVSVSTFNPTTTLSGTDPKFVNAANPIGPDNFWMTADDGLALADDSPAINAGTLAGAPTTDIRGLTRTGNPDQGAYEGSCTLPTAFTVTGGGGYCTGGSGVAIGLSGSESGVSYQLKNSANTVVATATGNGSALSFGTFTTAGTYTVVAIRTETCTGPMTGSATVSVNPPPTPSITASGPTTFCAGGSVTLSAGTYSSYVWKNGDTQVSTDPTYVATAPGSYTVTVTDGSCTATSSPVVVTVTTPVFTQQPSVPENLVVCANGTVSISFNVNCPGSGPFTAQLSNPGGTFTSGTQNLGTVTPGVANPLTIPGLTPTTSAAYRIRIVSNQPGFHSDSTGAFRINALAFNSTPTVSQVPACAGASIRVSFTLNGNCSFLPGNAFSAELSDGSGSFASPVVLSSVTPGINTLTVPPSTPTGSGYRVRIRATNPAQISAQSAPFSVNQPAFASTPSVSGDNKCAGESVRFSFSVGCAFFAGNTFTAQLSNASGVFAASPVSLGTVSPGALNNVVIPAGTPAGTGYKIRVLSSNPMVTSAVSANFRVKACGPNREIAPEATGLRVVVSPNPSPEGRLQISVSGADGQALRVEMFNGAGLSIRQQTLEKAGEEETLTWDISRQPQGLYLLRVSGGRETKTLKVLH